MSPRFFLIATLSLGLLVPAARVRAQDAQVPDVDNSKYQFAGEINSSTVYVRSGPSENYYPTLKLDKGAMVTVVGIRFDWLKIVPPDGSFCYVAKAYVEKRGDGSVGRVTKPDLNVRAGSSLNAMKTTVLSKLNEGDDVQILGEQDEYFKIKPPTGTYLYINKQFVDPVKAITADATTPDKQPDPAKQPDSGSATGTPAPAAGSGAKTADAGTTGTDSAANAGNTALTPSTQPADQNAAATPPSTQPADPSAAAATTQPTQQTAEAQFDALEVEYAAANVQPLDQQPDSELEAKYQDLGALPTLPESLHRIVDLRVATLKLRAEAKEQLLAARKAQEAAAQRELALKAERDELQERIKATEVISYAAVGTLQASSLQQGAGGTLYRLTDPATGRTVIYIRSNDAKVGGFLGQFVGVKGEPILDQQAGLRSITPTTIEPVDQSKLNVTVVADIVPPSLLPRAQASISNP